MSCVLRAAGDDFDVDAFLAECEILPERVFRKGEPRSRSSSKVNDRSGLKFMVSDAEMSEFDLQLEDAVSFLREKHELVKKLAEFPGVDGIGIDFGVGISPQDWRVFCFPRALVAAIGELGVDLEISTYPDSDEEE